MKRVAGMACGIVMVFAGVVPLRLCGMEKQSRPEDGVVAVLLTSLLFGGIEELGELSLPKVEAGNRFQILCIKCRSEIEGPGDEGSFIFGQPLHDNCHEEIMPMFALAKTKVDEFFEKYKARLPNLASQKMDKIFWERVAQSEGDINFEHRVPNWEALFSEERDKKQPKPPALEQRFKAVARQAIEEMKTNLKPLDK